MDMPTDTERRDVAHNIRENYVRGGLGYKVANAYNIAMAIGMNPGFLVGDIDLWYRLADLIEPSYKPSAEYETWYNSLAHYGSAQNEPSTIHELIEEIVWTALTVDLGPNGNTDPSTGIDEGDVYTNNLFAEWEREALCLSGGCDRDALLALAEVLSTPELETDCGTCPLRKWCEEARDSGNWITCFECKLWHTADVLREALGIEP